MQTQLHRLGAPIVNLILYISVVHTSTKCVIFEPWDRHIYHGNCTTGDVCMSLCVFGGTNILHLTVTHARLILRRSDSTPSWHWHARLKLVCVDKVLPSWCSFGPDCIFLRKCLKTRSNVRQPSGRVCCVIRRLSLVVSRLLGLSWSHGCRGGKVRPRSGELGVESGLCFLCTALLRTANEHREDGGGGGPRREVDMPGTWNLFLQAPWHRHEDGWWLLTVGWRRRGTRAEDIGNAQPIDDDEREYPLPATVCDARLRYPTETDQPSGGPARRLQAQRAFSAAANTLAQIVISNARHCHAGFVGYLRGD
jgi:hypothetical protein